MRVPLVYHWPLFRPNTYGQNQTAVNINGNGNQKSPTIPNIILTGKSLLISMNLRRDIAFFRYTDVDSSKLDLSKELANDFSSAFDALIDSTDLQLTADDFVSDRELASLLFEMSQRNFSR